MRKDHYICQIAYGAFQIHPDDVAALIRIAKRANRLEGYGPYNLSDNQNPFVESVSLAEITIVEIPTEIPVTPFPKKIVDEIKPDDPVPF